MFSVMTALNFIYYEIIKSNIGIYLVKFPFYNNIYDLWNFMYIFYAFFQFPVSYIFIKKIKIKKRYVRGYRY